MTKPTTKKPSRGGRSPGRPRSEDPRRTNHITLSTAERAVCESMAARVGLGFSPWGRFVLLSAAAEEVAAGQLPTSNLGTTVKVLARALVRVLQDLPYAQADSVRAQLVAALRSCNEEALQEIHKLGVQS